MSLVTVVMWSEPQPHLADFKLQFDSAIESDVIIEYIFVFLHSYYRHCKADMNKSNFYVKKTQIKYLNIDGYEISVFHNIMGYQLLCYIDKDCHIFRNFSRTSIGNISQHKYRFHNKNLIPCIS